MKPFGPACDSCRIKKSACDRVKPVCSRCIQSGNPGACSYRTEESTPVQMKPFDPACDSCRIKKSACDRVKPVCSRCIQSGNSGACSYRTEESTPVQMKPFDPACDSCRIKKRACDRVKPVCLRCIKSGNPGACSYRTEESTPVQRNPKRVKTHHPRPTPTVVVNRLSDAGSFSTEDISSDAELDEDDDKDDSPRSRRATPNQNGHDPEVIDLASPQSNESFHTAIMLEEAAPTADARGSRPFQLKGQKGALCGQIGRLLHEAIDDSPLTRRGLGLVNGLSPAHDARCREYSERISPDLADDLVEAYFITEYANLPIFDLQDFRSSYGAIRMGRKIAAGSTPFHGLLMMIFSLSGLNYDGLEETYVASMFNYGQTVSRDSDAHSSPSERVQSYILQSQYLYASGNPRAALILSGSAIRIAQLLSLEYRTRDRHARSRRDEELARRLWHSAVLLERMIAFQLRISPQTSQLSQVPLPVHMDTDYVDAVSQDHPPSNGERASIAEFLAACIGLYEHVEEILSWEAETRMRQGSCAAKKLLSLDLSSFVRLDGALYRWQMSLPSFLQTSKPNTESTHSIIHRQRSILRARYLYVRLRLYRPLLILGLAACERCSCQAGGSGPHFKLDQSSPDCPIALTLVRDSSLKCIEAAQEVVDLCEHEQESLFPSWETVDYLYVCGTVFLAAQSCPFISKASGNRPDPEEMELSLGRVLDLLEVYQTMQPSGRIHDIAQRCRRILESVEGIVEGSDEAVVFDDDNPRHLLERMNMRSPHNQEESMQRNLSRLGLFNWLGSLPEDLTDDLG